MELNNNYWKIYLNELPSKGITYSKDAIIRLRPLNVQEVKYLGTLNKQNASDIINEIIYKCIILENIKFEEILLADREYFIFWLRSNSFTMNSSYELKLTCSKCNQKFEYNIPLNDMEIIYLNNKNQIERVIYLPDANIHIKLKQPTIKELSRKYEEDEELQNFLRFIDIEDYDVSILVKLYNMLSALDYTILMNELNSMFIGFNRIINVPCQHCGEILKVNLVITENGLFSTINLFELIELIVRISKYANYQIYDNMPWWEVEILQKTVNKIAEEERQQMEKEKGNISLSKPTFNMNSFKNSIKR